MVFPENQTLHVNGHKQGIWPGQHQSVVKRQVQRAKSEVLNGCRAKKDRSPQGV
jgi:hypothetical protein